VQTALRLGHDLAAKVPSIAPEGTAWVWIQPIMRSGKAYRDLLDEWTLRHEAREGYDDTILRYRVRLLDLSSWNEEEDNTYAIDHVERSRAIRDEKSEVEDTVALEQWLTQYLSDLTLLRMPSSVEYHFDNY